MLYHLYSFSKWLFVPSSSRPDDDRDENYSNLERNTLDSDALSTAMNTWAFTRVSSQCRPEGNYNRSSELLQSFRDTDTSIQELMERSGSSNRDTGDHSASSVYPVTNMSSFSSNF